MASVIENPDVQRLIIQLEKLRAENKRLSGRDCNASIQLILPQEDGNPFNKEDCKVVDVGVSDNSYVIECDAVSQLQANNKKLEEQCRQYRMMDKANYVVCGNCGKEYHTLKLFDCPHCEKAEE